MLQEKFLHQVQVLLCHPAKTKSHQRRSSYSRVYPLCPRQAVKTERAPHSRLAHTPLTALGLAKYAKIVVDCQLK